MVSQEAKLAIMYEVKSSLVYAAGIIVLWILFVLFGVDPPLMGLALGLGCVALSKLGDGYLGFGIHAETPLDVLIYRFSTNLTMGVCALLMSGIMGVFASSPRGPISVITAYASIVAILDLGRFIIMFHNFLLRMDADFFANTFDWRQRVVRFIPSRNNVPLEPPIAFMEN